jgi:hypothetical protein
MRSTDYGSAGIVDLDKSLSINLNKARSLKFEKMNLSNAKQMILSVETQNSNPL